jgi:hypothetical protein
VSAPQLHRCPGTAHPPRCVCHGGNVSCREELIRITPQAAPLVEVLYEMLVSKQGLSLLNQSSLIGKLHLCLHVLT